jgi:hypothetical protein
MGEAGSTIDFDHAEYGRGSPAAPCTRCRRPLEGEYYKFQNGAVCSACRGGIEAAVAKATSAASLGKAALQGIGVALACGVAYAIFAAASHAQFALVTIGIAFVIAKVMRRASGGMGGLRFQILAVALTYLASSMGYLSPVVTMIYEHEWAPGRAAHVSDAPAGGGNADAQDDPDAGGAPLANGALVLALVKVAGSLFAYALIAPFAEATHSPLGLLIVGFGLWEAWKLMRPIPIVFEGPYRIGLSKEAASPP